MSLLEKGFSPVCFFPVIPVTFSSILSLSYGTFNSHVNPATDTELMLRVRDGEFSSLGVLFERHHIPLYNYYVRLTKDAAVSEDCVQEVFLRMLQYRNTFRGDGSFTAWMYHVARNVRIDRAKRWKNEEQFDEAQHEVPARDPNPGEALVYKQNLAVLDKALARLSPDKREVLILSRYQDMKYETIAEVLGCSVEAVKVRVHRAMNDLRKLFHELSGEPS